MRTFLRLLSLLLCLAPAVVRAEVAFAPAFKEKFHLLGTVHATVPLPNGQIVIGGDFETVNGVAQRFLARLNADGTLDSAWRPQVGFPVRQVAVDGDEVYFIGDRLHFQSRFFVRDDTADLRRVLLSGDGAIDTTWIPDFAKLRGTASFRQNQDIAVAGNHVYLLVEKGSQTILVRFLRSGPGTLDSSWKQKKVGTFYQGRILVDGAYVYVGFNGLNPTLQRFAVAAPGVEDRRFRRALGRFASLRGLAQDGEFIYAAGSFFRPTRKATLDALRISKSLRLLDEVWTPPLAGNNLVAVGDGAVFFIEAIGGVRKLRIVPLGPGNPTGQIATTTELSDNDVAGIVAAGDSLFLANGGANTIDRLQRLSARDGAVDARFTPRLLRSATITQVLRAANGTTYVAGDFNAVGDVLLRNLVRFTPDGFLDRTWTPNPQEIPASVHVEDNFLYFAGKRSGGGDLKVSRVSLASPGTRDSTWNPDAKLDALRSEITTGAAFGPGALFVVRFASPRIQRLQRVPFAGDGTPDPVWDEKADDLDERSGFLVRGAHLYAKTFGGVVRFPLAGDGTRDGGWMISAFPDSIAGDDTWLYLSYSIAGGAFFTRHALAGNGARDVTWRPVLDTLEPTATLPGASMLRAGPWLYVSYQVSGFRDAPDAIGLARINDAGAVDPSFTATVADAFPSWVGAFGDSPILGGRFSEIDGVAVAAPAIFNALAPPVLSRVGIRVFAVAKNAAELGIGFFRVTGLAGGSLSDSIGTPVALGSYVTRDEAAAGLDFTPDPLFVGTRSLSLASATAPELAATGNDSATIDLTDTLPPRSRYRLAAEAVTVREGAAQVLIAVEKVGAAVGSVTFAIEDGVARVGQHFNLPAVLTLDFPAGDGMGTIAVPLLDDLAYTGNKDFRVVLTGASDNGLLLPPLATNVTIEDDDPIGSTESLTTRPALTDPPAASASLRVDLNVLQGAWRLLGEASWHASGETLAGLTRGNYFVEFRQANGTIAPTARTVPLDFGEAAIIAGNYQVLGTLEGGGALSVTIEPASVATAAGDARGQWRLAGETAWRDSGAVVEGLFAGPYEVEFKTVEGRETPPQQTVNVAGAIVYSITGTYLIAPTATGAAPLPVDFATVKTAPYGFVGQIQTPLGFASGTAVHSHVVLTVAHALFDDETLSDVTDVRWYHQKASDDYEPPPQVARGWYIFEGYGAQRAADLTTGGSVGLSTPESQRLDVAALFFLEPCARGSFAGYLRTDAGNDWLLAARRRILAGYPAEGVADGLRGVLHATDPNVASTFTAPDAVVRATDALRGFPGMSGGPLFVEENGAFYPAGVFLGGTAQTLVRVIDAQAVDLVNRAELSGNGGDNNVGGGIIVVSPGITGSPFAPTLLGCTLGPAGALAGGAAWRIAGEDTFRASGERVQRNPGTYRLEFKRVPGFATPDSLVVKLIGGQVATARVNYVPGARVETTISPAGAGAAPSGDFELGQAVTLIARPAPDFLFSAWVENGNVISRNAKLTITINGPRNLTAQFVEGSYVPYKGSYAGLHESGSVADGFATFTITGNGSFTGKVSYGGATYSVRGTLDEGGVFSGPLGKASLLLEIDRTTPVGVLTGQIFGGSTPTTFTATQSPFDKSRPTALAGDYTLLLPSADPADASRPPGAGYATMTVQPSGAVTFKGLLADGVALTGASQIVADNTLPIYAATFKGDGGLAGALTFRDRPGVSAADGSVRWLRPPGPPRDKLYPAGFETTLPAVAARYVPPPIAVTSGTLRLNGATLTSPLTRSLAFSAKFVGTSASDPSVKLTLNAKSGVFTGAIDHPTTGKPLRLDGAIFQATPAGKGFLRAEPPTTGAVELTLGP